MLLEHGVPLPELEISSVIPRTQMQNPAPVNCDNQDISIFMTGNVGFFTFKVCWKGQHSS